MRGGSCKVACSAILVLLLGPASSARGSEAGSSCARAIEQALSRVERVPPARRAPAALAELARVECLGALASAAGTSARAKRPVRARALAKAAAPELPASCLAKDPTASALTLSERCPAPKDLAPSRGALRDLDAGTYLFVLAAHARLSASGELGSHALQLLNNLLLGAALEGEAARGQR